MNQIIMVYKIITRSKFDLFLKLIILFIFCVSVFAFWQPFFDPFGPSQLMIIRIFIPITILLYISINLNKEILLKVNSLIYFLFLYIFISFISILSAYNKEIAFKYFLELFLFVFGAYFLYSIIEKKFIKKMIVIILIIHVIISCYGILQHFNIDFFKWNTNFAGRPMGTIGNPNFFAGQLLFPLFFLISYLFYSKKNIFLKIISFFIIALTFYYTQVIGAFIGFLFGLVIFFIIILFHNIEKIKIFIKNKFSLFIFVILMIICVILYGAINNKIKKILIEKKRSIAHRLLMWEASLLMIYDSPWIGKGIGNYRIYYPYYQAKLLNNSENKKYDYVVTWMPHQNYLLIAAEIGLLGFLMFFFTLILFYIISWKIIFIQKIKDPIPIGIITGVTSILGASLSNTFYNIPSTTLYFFFFLFIINDYYQEKQKYYILKGRLLYLLFIIFSVIFIFNMIMDSKTLLSNLYLKQANKFIKNKNYNNAIENYENIIKLNPIELCPQMNVSHYYFTAEAYRETGNFEKAKNYYYKELQINPYSPEVNNMLGALLGQMGYIDESIKKLEFAVYIAPHYEAAYINLATAYFIKKDYDSVQKVINRYIELNGETQIFREMLNQIKQVINNKR